jgi:hypothetical protein
LVAIGFQDVFCFDWPTKDAAELTMSEPQRPASTTRTSASVGASRRGRATRSAATTPTALKQIASIVSSAPSAAASPAPSAPAIAPSAPAIAHGSDLGRSPQSDLGRSPAATATRTPTPLGHNFCRCLQDGR